MGGKYPPKLELSFPLQCNNIQLTLLLLGVRPLGTKEPTIASILRQLDKCKARRHEPWSRGLSMTFVRDRRTEGNTKLQLNDTLFGLRRMFYAPQMTRIPFVNS